MPDWAIARDCEPCRVGSICDWLMRFLYGKEGKLVRLPIDAPGPTVTLDIGRPVEGLQPGATR